MALKDLNMLNSFAQVVVKKIGDFGQGVDGMALMAPCQDLTLMFWAFAALHFHHEPALDALETAASTKSGELNPQNLANISWTLATLDKDMPLFSVISNFASAKTIWQLFLFASFSNPLHGFECGFFLQDKLLKDVEMLEEGLVALVSLFRLVRLGKQNKPFQVLAWRSCSRMSEFDP